MPPGCGIGAQLRLDKYFDISQPGSYTALIGTTVGGLSIATTASFDVQGLGASTPNEQKGRGEGKADRKESGRAVAEAQRLATPASAGLPFKGLTLRSMVSPVDRRSVNLVVALTNDGQSNARAVDGNAQFWMRRELPEGRILPEGSVSYNIGNSMSDYRLVIRESDGRVVPLTEAGKRLLKVGRRYPPGALCPGEALGFVLPLDRMYQFKPGGIYTVLAALTTSDGRRNVLVASPVAIRIPEKVVVGINRPAFGSPYFIAALQEVSRIPRKDIQMISRVEHQIDSLFFIARLESRIERPIKPWLRAEDYKDAMFVFLQNDRGEPVLPNENGKVARLGWGMGDLTPLPSAAAQGTVQSATTAAAVR